MRFTMDGLAFNMVIPLMMVVSLFLFIGIILLGAGGMYGLRG